MPTFMRTFSIFCVFLFFSGFAFGQTKTVTLNILDAIDENPSFFDTLVIYDLTAKKVVFFSDKKERKIELKLEKNKIYEFYGMNYGYKMLIETDTFSISHKSSFDFYTLDLCSYREPYYFKNDSTEISQEMIEQIELINKIVSYEKEDEDLIYEVGIGLCLLRDSTQSEKSKDRLRKIESMLDKKPVIRIDLRMNSSYADDFEEYCFLGIRIIQDADIKKVRTLAKTYSNEKKSPKIYKK